MAKLCIDASLILTLVLPTEQNEKADALWEEWASYGIEVIAPPLLYAEVTSVIRETVYRGEIRPEEGEDVFAAFCALEVKNFNRPDLHLKAWELAKELNQPKAYDAQYLALAQLEGCPLWTGDKRLVRAAAEKLPEVKWVGDYSPEVTS